MAGDPGDESPPTIQYDANFDVNILEPVTLALRDVFQAAPGEVIVMPGSGRTSLEPSRCR